jgi:hypothetical protein
MLPTQSEMVALSTRTFDAEHLIQILAPNDEVLITIGTPAGPGGPPTEFCIWQGDGIAEDGGEDEPVCRITAQGSKVGLGHDNWNAAWLKAVREGYNMALNRLIAMAAIAIDQESKVG